jgi:Zn-finger protein
VKKKKPYVTPQERTEIEVKKERRIESNNKLVITLKTYELSGKLNTPEGRQTLKLYNRLQELLSDCEDPRIRKFTPEEIQASDRCLVCGFPANSLLTKHHLVPKALDAKSRRTVKLCPNCHLVVHKCSKTDSIPEDIIQYYSSVKGAVDKLRELIDIAYGRRL